jgi:CheY-like chemotaxis protein
VLHRIAFPVVSEWCQLLSVLSGQRFYLRHHPFGVLPDDVPLGELLLAHPVVLMDLLMPRMDGIAATEAIRAEDAPA